MPGPEKRQTRVKVAGDILSDMALARRRFLAARVQQRRMEPWGFGPERAKRSTIPTKEQIVADLGFSHFVGPAFPMACDFRAWPLSFAVEAARRSTAVPPAVASVPPQPTTAPPAQAQLNTHTTAPEGRMSFEFPTAVSRRVAPRQMVTSGLVRLPRHLRKQITINEVPIRTLHVQVPRPTCDVADVEARVYAIVGLRLSEQTRMTVSNEVLVAAVHRLLEGIRDECGAVLPGHLIAIERAVKQDLSLAESFLEGSGFTSLLAQALLPAVPRAAG